METNESGNVFLGSSVVAVGQETSPVNLSALLVKMEAESAAFEVVKSKKIDVHKVSQSPCARS